MPDTARILRFPEKPSLRDDLSREAAAARAAEYLRICPSERTDLLRDRLVANAETMLCLLGTLRNRRDSHAEETHQESAALYTWLVGYKSAFGCFDERDYFKGEIALVSAASCRILGRRDQAELWLDRADAAFRHTLNPGPLLAMTAYTRLALRYDMRRYDEVLELLPSLIASFKKYGMGLEIAKCQFLTAATLKECSREADALDVLSALVDSEDCQRDAALFGLALATLGEMQSVTGDLNGALSSYQRAAEVLKNADRAFGLAHLKAAIAQTLRDQGNVAGAIAAYREAATEYAALGMTALAAYMRVVTAESLLAAGRAREAEFELLTAMPVIDQEKMLPEAQAALRLLRESIQQRKTQPGTLSELRKHLSAKS
jgi:tetratricopeptide (TPR) repeat protein